MWFICYFVIGIERENLLHLKPLFLYFSTNPGVSEKAFPWSLFLFLAVNSHVQENDDSFEFDTERTWVPTGCAWVSGSIMPEQQMGRLVRKSGVWDDEIQWFETNGHGSPMYVKVYWYILMKDFWLMTLCLLWNLVDLVSHFPTNYIGFCFASQVTSTGRDRQELRSFLFLGCNLSVLRSPVWNFWIGGKSIPRFLPGVNPFWKCNAWLWQHPLCGKCSSSQRLVYFQWRQLPCRDSCCHVELLLLLLRHQINLDRVLRGVNEECHMQLLDTSKLYQWSQGIRTSRLHQAR